MNVIQFPSKKGARALRTPRTRLFALYQALLEAEVDANFITREGRSRILVEFDKVNACSASLDLALAMQSKIEHTLQSCRALSKFTDTFRYSRLERWIEISAREVTGTAKCWLPRIPATRTNTANK